MRVRALIAKQDLGNSQMMALMVPFALSGRHLRPALSAGINQAQSQQGPHPRCCESTATATPCWPTCSSSGQSSSYGTRSGSAHTCSRPFVCLGLSGERLTVFVDRSGMPVRKLRTMPMARALELARKLQGLFGTTGSVV